MTNDFMAQLRNMVSALLESDGHMVVHDSLYLHFFGDYSFLCSTREFLLLTEKVIALFSFEPHYVKVLFITSSLYLHFFGDYSFLYLTREFLLLTEKVIAPFSFEPHYVEVLFITSECSTEVGMTGWFFLFSEPP